MKNAVAAAPGAAAVCLGCGGATGEPLVRLTPWHAICGVCLLDALELLRDHNAARSRAQTGRPAPPKRMLSPEIVALSRGYTGDVCSNCGSFNMVRTGTCATCTECGESSGGCG